MRKESRNFEMVMNQGTDLIQFYRENPCIAAYDLLRVDFAPIQRLIFEDMWFKNYTIAIMGRGGGKSAAVNSLSFIGDKGLCYLHEEFEPIPSFLSSGETIEIDSDQSIYTSEGFKYIKKVSLEKEISGLKVKTKLGLRHKGSYHHPLLTINEQGNFYYKQSQDFEVGDYICVQRGQNVFGENNIVAVDSYLIGLFIGDGGISDKYSSQDITTEDDFIKDFCVNYCKKNNILYRIDVDKRTKNTVKIIFKQFSWFFEKYDIKRCLSYYKEVPYSIRTAGEQAQINFLRGLYDTDGGFEEKGIVTYCSVSKKLVEEVQMMLLNFGIISRCREKPTKSEFGKAFILTISGEDVKLFYDIIGFNLRRKQKSLGNYTNSTNFNTNNNIIPFIKNTIIKELAEKYGSARSFSKLFSNTRYRFDDGNRKSLSYDVLDKIVNTIELYNVDQEIYNKLLYIRNTNYYFDRVDSIEEWSGDCYDFEMDMGSEDIEPNYFCNGFVNHNTFMLGTLATLSCLLYPGYRVGLIGPVFRQSKMVFSEVEKLYGKSPILKEACEKKPTRGSDTCYLRFKSIGGASGSFIEALPLGVDGSKIRGSRFYLLLLDELAQIPDKTLDMVVRPMGATTLEPMANVRRLEKQNRLIELGLATEDDFEEDTVNKMVMTSSGFYKFNHMWRRMKDHWWQMEEHGDKSQYSVWQVPYWELPLGFLDKNNIMEAKRIMSDAEFRMEYEAAMISDSEGFFKASVLENCTMDSGFTVELKGEPGAEYILGIDPSQGGSASCGVVIIKVGKPSKVVSVLELKLKTTQELTQVTQTLCEIYNVIRIFMDKGGGGKAIMDLLEEGYGGYDPIIDRTDKDKRNLKGRHILEMVNFNPSWISDANFTTLAMLEDRSLLFPEAPLSTADVLAEAYESIRDLKKQMLNIIVTQTGAGALHFDTPKKGQNKDLYSAMILAAHGVRMFTKELEEDADPILYNKSGFVREHGPNAQWGVLNNKRGVRPGVAPIGNDRGIFAASLKNKRRIK